MGRNIFHSERKEFRKNSRFFFFNSRKIPQKIPTFWKYPILYITLRGQKPFRACSSKIKNFNDLSKKWKAFYSCFKSGLIVNPLPILRKKWPNCYPQLFVFRCLAHFFEIGTQVKMGTRENTHWDQVTFIM